jgi:hypothetical protein
MTGSTRLMKITEQDMPRVALDSFTAGARHHLLRAHGRCVRRPSARALDRLRNDDNVHDLQLLYDHHVVGHVVLSVGDLWSKIEGGDGVVEALDESPIRLTLVDGVLHMDGATVIEGDIEAVTGVIHVIDAVMVPDSVSILIAAEEDEDDEDGEGCTGGCSGRRAPARRSQRGERRHGGCHRHHRRDISRTCGEPASTGIVLGSIVSRRPKRGAGDISGAATFDEAISSTS